MLLLCLQDPLSARSFVCKILYLQDSLSARFFVCKIKVMAAPFGAIALPSAIFPMPITASPSRTTWASIRETLK